MWSEVKKCNQNQADNALVVSLSKSLVLIYSQIIGYRADRSSHQHGVVQVSYIQIAYRSIFKDTDEGRCEWHKATTLPINVVPNLRFLIPLCMLRLQDKSIKYFNLNYD
jgi:hypothetical protein